MQLLIFVLTVASVTVAACAPAAPPAAPVPSPTPQPSPTATAAATVQAVTNTGLGAILADGSGRTVYLFTRDEKNKSNCTGPCLTTWPPLKVSGAPKAGPGVKAELLSSITREDNTLQATYNGMPLHLFAGDTAPGETKGQGVGGIWFVVSPDGEPVRSAAAAPPAGGAGGAGGIPDY